MKIGKYELDRGDISVGFMILFALLAMFMLGVQYSYSAAVTHANNQLNENMDNYCVQKAIGNTPPPVKDMLGGFNIEGLK